jgi:glyoxylase-like metal-dependent hydrolase (beta-lactamase superfamily II)
MPDSRDSSPVSRRGFLQGVAASSASTQLGAAATAQPELPRFSPEGKPRKISENLFVLEDTCNVYLIREGSRGLLIDFGSGAILSHLGELGVSSIDWILHTHHHRDQAQGDYIAAAQRIPIAVPVHERHLFEAVENFWRNRRIFELYTVRNDFFSLTRNVPVTAVLRDYSTFEWSGYRFFIQPTPGHTPGSIPVLAQVDGRKVAFSGDLMHSPGKVQTLYDLQYYYGEHEGVDLSAYSLAELIKLKPGLLCPSHGPDVADPVPGMEQLITKLSDWFRFWNPSGGLMLDNKPRELTPHVVGHAQTTSSFYAIISDSGKALFIDYGSASWNFFSSFLQATDTYDRMRFVEHSVDRLRARHGLKSIDVALPSHMHDDHLNGFPHLARRFGTRIWCYENMVEILENPRGRNLGCILGEPIHVERSFHDRETFRWEEFEFTIVHSPGHTNYQSALFATIDGARIAFTGDAFFNDSRQPNEIRHNLIYRNDVKSGDHAKSIRNILEFEPHIIAPGHGQPFLIDVDMARGFEAKMKRQDAFFRELIADPDTDTGLDPAWVQLYPYQSLAMPGQTRNFEVRARNQRQRAIELEVVLALPLGWRSDPANVKLSIAPGESGSVPVSVTIPRGWAGAPVRLAIAVDVKADGKYLGQIAEAVIDVRASGIPAAATTAGGF